MPLLGFEKYGLLPLLEEITLFAVVALIPFKGPTLFPVEGNPPAPKLGLFRFESGVTPELERLFEVPEL